MNIPPLLSRTPPPLCDSENNDNDDAEFGNFVMCSDIGGETYDDYQNVGKIAGVEDTTSEDSGLCTGSSMGQAHSPYETSPTTGHKGLHNGEDHGFDSLPLSDLPHGHKQLKQHHHHTICDDAIIIGEVDGEAHIEVEEVETIIATNMEIGPGHMMITETVKLDDLTEQSVTHLSPEPLSSSSITPSNTTNTNFVANLENFREDEDGEFEEFQVFDSLETNQFRKSNDVDRASTSDCSYLCEDETNLTVETYSKEINNKTDEEWDQCKQTSPVDCCTADDKEVTDDDPDEFTDFQTSSFPSEEDHSSLHFFHHYNFNAEVGNEPELFKENSTAHLNINSEGIPTLLDLVYQNSVWSHLHSLDETPAFRYQWASSLTNRKLLSALKIDSRNILSSLWSKSVKLGGLDGSSLDQSNLGYDIKDTSKNHSAAVPKNIVPDAHFDWVGSGLTNPLDSNADNSCISTIAEFGLEPIKISQQAEEILSTLPDRSYLKKTYIVFKKTS